MDQQELRTLFIKETEKEIKEAEGEIELFNARIALDNKCAETIGISPELKQQFYYSVESHKNLMSMEEIRRAEASRELAIAKCRKETLERFYN